MTVKLMLNKDKEIKRLAQDPEVQIRIKEAIVDAIAKRAVKALDSGEIRKAIDETVKTTLLKDKPSWQPPLKENIAKRVETAAKDALDDRLHEILVDALPGYEVKFRQILDERLKEIEKLDFADMAQRAVNRYVTAKFSQ